METPSQSAEPSSLSPSLTSARRAKAFEVKFVIDEPTAAALEARLAPWLRPDPHTDTASGGYSITSIYSDTPGWDVFFREGPHGRRKYRVRRYGTSGPTFLERKTVRGTWVRKRRIAVDGDIARIIEHDSGGPESGWFPRQVAAAGLRPVCRISYERRALFGECPDGPMRITFDRAVRGFPVNAWHFNGTSTTQPLLDGVIICEFKFRDAMPGPMKSAIAELQLQPRGVSKYRACIGAFGRELGLPSRGEAHA